MKPRLRFNHNENYSYELFKDVFQIKNNNSFSREELKAFGNFKNIHYGDIHTKLNKITDVQSTELPYIAQENEVKLTELCNDYDVLIADASEDYSDIGKCIQLINVKNCVAGLHTILARPKYKSLYLTHLLSSWYVRKQFMKLACGAKVLGLSKSSLQKVVLPFPKLEEQTKIATFLNLYYKKIELQRKKVDLLKLQKHQIINTIFKFDDKVNYIKLNKLLNQISIKNKNNLDVPVLSVSNKFGFIPQSEQFEEEVASDDKSNYKLVKLNQFAYNPARINVGSIAKLIDPYTCGQISPMYVCFECDSTLNSDYFGYYLQSSTFKKEMQKRLEGSVRMCLTFESLCNIKISLQELSKQLLVVDKLKKIDLKIKTEATKLLLLEKYKQGLLQKMFI